VGRAGGRHRSERGGGSGSEEPGGIASSWPSRRMLFALRSLRIASILSTAWECFITTPDCEAAVKTLGKYLKPGGILAVWLYSGYNKWYRFSDFWRRYNAQMKPETLHSVLKVAVRFLYIRKRCCGKCRWWGVRPRVCCHHVFPVNRQSTPEARMLDTSLVFTEVPIQAYL